MSNWDDGGISKAQRESEALSKVRSTFNTSFVNAFGYDDDESSILFLNGSEEHIDQDSEKFWEVFQSFVEIQKDFSDKKCDLSYLIFPHDQNNILKNIINNSDISFNFNHCIFNAEVDLSGIKIQQEINFEQVVFKKNVDFKYTTFFQTSIFSDISFEGDTYFSSSAFMEVIDFQNSACEGIFDFSDVAFHSLHLDKSYFPHASYLRLDGWNDSKYEDVGREVLSAKHFETKETARIIKAHFEKQNNITESNIYYPIEMDKYREEIASHSNPLIAFFTNQNYFVTTLSKYISNYGTSWFRAGLVIFFFSFFIAYIYSFLYINIPQGPLDDPKHFGAFNPKISIYYLGLTFFWFGLYLFFLFIDSEIGARIKKSLLVNNVLKAIIFMLVIASISICFFFYNEFNYDTILDAHNYVSKVVNPFGAFKTNDIFKHNEAFGTIVRLITLTLMYQFIVAFRQNTRRK